MTSADRFRILVVCTANICRSPLAAELLRRRLIERFGAEADDVEVTSAGVRALVGDPMDPYAAALLAEATTGPDGTPAAQPFAARQVDERLVGEADLVLTMTREHRRSVVQLVPAAQRRTFTLRELARIVRAAPARPDDTDPSLAAGWRTVLTAAPALRGPTAPRDPADDDVADPYRLDGAVYRHAVRTISAAIDDVVHALPAQPRPGSPRT